MCLYTLVYNGSCVPGRKGEQKKKTLTRRRPSHGCQYGNKTISSTWEAKRDKEEESKGWFVFRTWLATARTRVSGTGKSVDMFSSSSSVMAVVVMVMVGVVGMAGFTFLLEICCLVGLSGL